MDITGGDNIYLLILLATASVMALLVAILGVVVFRRKRRERKMGVPKNRPASGLAVFFACWGTFVASNMLLWLVLFVFGVFEDCLWLMNLWMLLGWTIIFPVFWRIYAKRLKRVRLL